MMPQVPIANYAFQNQGDFRFRNMAEAWGLAQPDSRTARLRGFGTTAGTSICSEQHQRAGVDLRSHAREINKNHYLTVQLRGSECEHGGIGAKLVITQKGEKQMWSRCRLAAFSHPSIAPHSGSVRPAGSTLLPSLPDHRFQTLTNLEGDRILTLSQQDATGSYRTRIRLPSTHPRAEQLERCQISQYVTATSGVISTPRKALSTTTIASR